eukprot:s5659_g3.t4
MRVLVIEADAASLTTVATSCRRARQWELGIDLLRRMTDSSMEVDDVAVNSAVGSTATGAGMPLSLWQHCLRSVLGPDAAAKGQAWPMAADLLRGMACRRMTTHAASATLVLHVVGWKRSLDMLFWLRRMSMQIDGVFQSVLADAMAKAGQWRFAAATCLGAVGVAATVGGPNAGCWRFAASAFARLAARRCADAVMASAALGAVARAESWHLAQILLRLAPAELVDRITFASAAAGAAAAGLLQLARERGLQPTQAMVAKVVKVSTWLQARESLQQMKAVKIAPDVLVQNAEISTGKAGGMWRAPVQLLERLAWDFCRPDVASWSSVAASCTSANFWSVAAELLRSYSAQNLQTNAFLVTSATSRSWTRAFGLCKAYRHSSVTNSALGALARHGRWRLAIALLHRDCSVSAAEPGDERERVIGTNSAIAAFVVEGPWPRALSLASGCSDALGGSAAVAAAHHWEVSLTLLWTLQRQFHLDEDCFNAALRVCARSCEGRLPRRFRADTFVPVAVLPSSEWDRRARKALWLCDQSWIAVKNGSTGNLEQAAQMAVDAWGGTLMRGHDCCIMLAPPYCYTMKTDVFDFAIPVLLSLFAMLFAAVASKSCALWVRQLGRKAPEEQFHGKEPQQGQPQSAVDLEQKLLAIWDQSCLGGKGDPQKALPRSREWGRAAANFFATMKLAFDFQASRKGMMRDQQHDTCKWNLPPFLSSTRPDYSHELQSDTAELQANSFEKPNAGAHGELQGECRSVPCVPGSLTSLSALKKGRGCALVWGRDNSLQPIAKKKRVGGREEEGSQSVSVQEYSRCQTALLVQRRSHAAIVTDRAIQDAVENKWRWVSGSLSEQSKGGLDVSHKAPRIVWLFCFSSSASSTGFAQSFIVELESTWFATQQHQAMAPASDSDAMDQLMGLAAQCMSDDNWTQLLNDRRVKLAHRECSGHRQMVRLVITRVAIRDPPKNPSHLLVRPEVRAQYQKEISPVSGHSLDLVETNAPGDGIFWRFQQFGLLKLCCLFFGSLAGSSANRFFCTDTPTLGHHKLKRDFPEPGDCVYAGRMDNTQMECDGVSEGVFITHPTADSSEFSVTVMFVLSHAQWKWAGWALPHIMRLAHLAERCIQWLLNRPGIAELRQLDEEHYIVLAISCTKRGPPLLPAGKDPTESIDIQAGEAIGFPKWRRFTGSAGEQFNLPLYLQDFMASLDEDVKIYSQMDGRPLVYYQCAINRRDWHQVRDRFQQVFHLQKAAYRRANGGSNAPSLTEDAVPRFVSNIRHSRDKHSPGLPVQKIVVRRTFVDCRLIRLVFVAACRSVRF